MQSGQLLRIAARSAARLYSPRPVSRCSSEVYGLPRRPLCANAAPTSKAPSSSAQTQGASNSVGTTAAESGKAASPAEASKASDVPKAANAASPAVAGTGESAAKIPDVSSTSLGLEDPMTNDPLKWRKFAYKYAGAVLLFFVSYKSLHWYVDRLEADGKRRREEVEENKAIVQGITKPQDTQSPAGISGIPAAPAVMTNPAVGASAMPMGPHSVVQHVPEEPLPAMRIFDPVKEEEPHLVSELDELYVYKIELEAKLRDLEAMKRTRELDAEKVDIEKELKQLVVEIAELELTKPKS